MNYKIIKHYPNNNKYYFNGKYLTFSDMLELFSQDTNYKVISDGKDITEATKHKIVTHCSNNLESLSLILSVFIK